MQTSENAVQTSIRVVLNGGSRIMESATIPFRWFFNDAVIEKQPTELLIIDQNALEMGSNRTDRRGERRIVPIRRGSDFMQFASPGHHRIAFIALKKRQSDSEKEYEEWKGAVLNQISVGEYSRDLDWNQIEKEEFGSNFSHNAVAATVVEIDVPKEFFAERSNNFFARLVWSWTNRWFEMQPRDECSYRKRLIWAFTLQPPVFVIGHILKYIAAFFCSIYFPTMRIAAFYFGYRPTPIFAEIGKLWSWKWQPKEIDWDIRESKSYRDWGWSEEKHEYIKMPITGFEITMALCLLAGMGGVGYLGYYLLSHFYGWELTLSAVVLSACVLFVIAFKFIYDSGFIVRTNWWNKMEIRWDNKRVKSNKRKKAQAPKPLLYFEWLRHVSHLSKAPGRVSFDDLPDAFDGQNLQRARIKFWALKAKMCRPFPRN